MKKLLSKIGLNFSQRHKISEEIINQIDQDLVDRVFVKRGSFRKEPLISAYEIADVQVGDTIAIIFSCLWAYTILKVTAVTTKEVTGLSVYPDHSEFDKNNLQTFAKYHLRLARNPMNYTWSEHGFAVKEENLLNLLNGMKKPFQFCADMANPPVKIRLYAHQMHRSLRKSVRP